jgi:hypothetical protein
VQRIVAAIKLASDADAMIVVVDPIAQNPAALHIVRSTSGVLLVARIGDSRLASARSTVNAVGRDRMLGSVALV